MNKNLQGALSKIEKNALSHSPAQGHAMASTVLVIYIPF